jgi:hypothetical protein
VKGITGESFVHESLILPEGVPALCDDAGLRTVILATLSTLDERGIAVRQTGGWDPYRGIRISDVPVGGPQRPHQSFPRPHRGPPPLGQGQRGCKQLLCPGGAGMSEEERRRRLHRADGSSVSDPPPLGPRRSAPRSVIGLLAGPRRPAPRQRARRGTPVLCHHSHRVRRHHNHHHRRARRRQQHLGMISPRGTSSSSNNSSSSSKSSGRPASRVAGRSRAPSECSHLLFD